MLLDIFACIAQYALCAVIIYVPQHALCTCYGMCWLIWCMCLLLHELLNIPLVLYIVRIARYVLHIAKCTYYFTCANLNASCNTQCTC